MPATGIEPVLYRYNRILSPVLLPIPPRRQISGTNRARTYDPLLVRQMLSQLSYDPKILIYKLFTNKTTRMGFEPTTSAVTGRRSNQLSHQAIISRIKRKWTFGDSNPGPTGYEPVALTN